MRNWWNGLADTLSQVATVIGVLVAMGTGWVVFWTWVHSWDWVQKGVAIFIGLCLLFLLVLSIYAWYRRTQVNKIPKLLYELDAITRDYIDEYDPSIIAPNDKSELAQDLAELFGISVWSYENAIRKKENLKQQTMRYASKLESVVSSDKSNQTLRMLLQLYGLMNQHGVGLKKLQDTPNYKDKKNTILDLRKIVPKPEVNIRINTYFNWADGYYSFLLGQKWVTSDPSNFALSPAEYKASMAYSRQVIEGTMDTLVSAVAESLDRKEKIIEKKDK